MLFKEHLYQTRNKSFWFSVVCLLHSFFFFFFPGHEVAQRLVLQCYDKITGSIPSGKFILIRTPLCLCVCRFSHKVPQLSLGEIVSGLRCRVVSRHQQKRRATHFYTTQTGLLGENNNSIHKKKLHAAR